MFVSLCFYHPLTNLIIHALAAGRGRKGAFSGCTQEQKGWDPDRERKGSYGLKGLQSLLFVMTIMYTDAFGMCGPGSLKIGGRREQMKKLIQTFPPNSRGPAKSRPPMRLKTHPKNESICEKARRWRCTDRHIRMSVGYTHGHISF